MNPEIMLLGVAQDGGMPQAGCNCAHCAPAHEDPMLKQFAACLGIVDHNSQSFWIIDATPDFREQLYLIQAKHPDYTLAGIFLTHAHIGHYTGLIHLGKEAMHTQNLPVYATPRMADFLSSNAPWNQLVAINNIKIFPTHPENPIILAENLSLLPILVPHRGEFSDTLAFTIQGPSKKAFYCPDIDSWHKTNFDLVEFFAQIDIALLDGTFYSPEELPGRDLTKIPHPMIQDSITQFQRLDTDIHFIHLNHSNPLWHKGAESNQLAEQGYGVGRQGQTWET